QFAQLRLFALEHLVVELILRLEVVIQGGGADARGASDVAHRRQTVAAVGEQPGGGADDALAGRRIGWTACPLHAFYRTIVRYDSGARRLSQYTVTIE